MQSSRSLVLLGSALGAALLAAACGSPSNPDQPRVSEVEPNDSQAQAQFVERNWSSVYLGGDCASATDQDWFQVKFDTYVQPAPFEATLSWTGGGSMGLTLHDAAGNVLSTDTGTSPDVVTSTLTTSGVVFLEVQCSTAAATWKIDIPAPGQNPGEA